MTRKGREFNEIYDLTAMRVIVDSVKDCYGTVGVIHSLWKPLPGRFKDFIAMPKFNMYQSLHTTVIGPEGRPLEIQIRTHEMHEMAEFGVAAHWVYKAQAEDEAGTGPAACASEDAKLKWLRSMVDWQKDMSDPQEFMETLRTDLFEEEVYVFTPKGEVKSLAAGATPLDFAYEVHTEIGHRCVGARVNGKIVPLHYELRSGDIVEILTAKRERGPSRDWLAIVKTTRARNKIKAWFKAESRVDTEHAGRELLQEQLRKAGPAGAADHRLGAARRRDPRGRLPQGRRLLHRARRREDLAEARRQQDHAAPQAGRGRRRRGGRCRPAARRTAKAPSQQVLGQYGIRVEGVDDVMLRLAKCCRPVPGDDIVGYISLGRGITIHRADCPNTASLRKNPDRFTNVSWDGEQSTGFMVEIQIDAWDRHRLLEDLSRAFSESGTNILEARCLSMRPMVKNRFVVELADTHTLKGADQRACATSSRCSTPTGSRPARPTTRPDAQPLAGQTRQGRREEACSARERARTHHGAAPASG